MRSNWIRDGGAEHRQMLREAAKAEIKVQKAEFCPKCEEQIQAHCIALLCYTLHLQYGFGKKRIADLIQGARGVDLWTVNTLHKSDDIWVDWLRDEMGIQLRLPDKKQGG